jgi:hypothetical protein
MLMPIEPQVTIKSASSDDIRQATQAKLGALQACYEKSLGRRRLSGELAIAIANGKVRVESATIKAPELDTCVLGVLRAASLPKTPTKASLVLSFVSS